MDIDLGAGVGETPLNQAWGKLSNAGCSATKLKLDAREAGTAVSRTRIWIIGKRADVASELGSAGHEVSTHETDEQVQLAANTALHAIENLYMALAIDHLLLDDSHEVVQASMSLNKCSQQTPKGRKSKANNKPGKVERERGLLGTENIRSCGVTLSSKSRMGNIRLERRMIA